ncbi:MAG: lantibiotic protection ABC transporter ATP-binding subunit [Miniphocaeibacter sp.]|uniref:lantibiotic protection ABC transporter ATP-binding subunit n=1 Tax=Miniphocaeibacter sp. TaxID=3100973 RepID=UPI003BB08520
MEYILKTENLTKIYGKQKSNNNINLNLKKNTIYGLLGPNGAGKSTLLKMICGISKPTSGSIYFENSLWKKEDIRKIGALIESPAIYPNLTAEENLRVYALMNNLENKDFTELLELVGLKKKDKKIAKKYSTGMKQRLGIAIALLKSPDLLILDEPTNGLDPLGIEELRKLIKSFPGKGITVILSSHILTEVEQVADTIGIIYNGKLEYEENLDKTHSLEETFMEIIRKGEAYV